MSRRATLWATALRSDRAASGAAARTVNAILTIAMRELLRFLRDRAQIVGTAIAPLIFVGALGGSLQANLGESISYDLQIFIFTGVLAQTLFQTTVTGLTSLIEDRENDFSQELFIAPIPRTAIVFGKILGASVVALLQAIVTIAFGLLLFGLPFDPPRLLALAPVALAICLLGGGFGVLLVSLFDTQRAANQILPFLIFPQIFLAGIFAPIRVLPWYLDILSRIVPLRYAVDLLRNVFYAGQPEYRLVVLEQPLLNLVVIAAMFVVFLIAGTALFVRGERNR